MDAARHRLSTAATEALRARLAAAASAFIRAADVATLNAITACFNLHEGSGAPRNRPTLETDPRLRNETALLRLLLPEQPPKERDSQIFLAIPSIAN